MTNVIGTPSEALGQFLSVRNRTESLTKPLAVEDMVVQSMPDVSPTKWHLAHTTWFFEEFILKAFVPGYREHNPMYGVLFNSYYQSLGHPFPRHLRGTLSRPTVKEVMRYRRNVEEVFSGWLPGIDEATWANVRPLLELGVNHEEQHQELILMDAKHVLGMNPLLPPYVGAKGSPSKAPPPLLFREVEGGRKLLGASEEGFAFDNERPRHGEWLPDSYLLGSRTTTNGEYLEFVAAGGYRNPEYWLSDGFDAVQRNGWEGPLYWHRKVRGDLCYALNGSLEFDPNEPVCHVSFFEADAYARFRGCRLPTEEEWEAAAESTKMEGNFQESGRYHPQAASDEGLPIFDATFLQMFGDVWEWTGSPYRPYAGFRPAKGAVGEYNGKFMNGQYVLRGGSCLTPKTHIRRSYRNFFPPDTRWQMSGIRLAKDID